MSSNIRIRFLAIFKDAAGKQEITQAIHEETTLGDVLNSLAKKYGKDFQETIDEKTRQVDVNTLVMLNGKNTRDTNLKLKDNDLIIMTVPLGGGRGSNEMSEARCQS
jgi:MoaD family protein